MDTVATQRITLDGRRRTSMAKVGHHDEYLAEEFADGTIVLTPAVTISVIELAALQEPKFHRAVGQAKAGKLVSRGSFKGKAAT